MGMGMGPQVEVEMEVPPPTEWGHKPKPTDVQAGKAKRFYDQL